MKRPYPILLVFTVLLALHACTRSYEIYSTKYRVSFSCDISLPPFNSLNTLGHFLAVRPTAAKDGYKVRLPNGKEQQFPYTEIQNRIFEFGLAGILIGRPYFGEGEIYAYDLACPQCDKSSARLTANTDGIATCAKCGNVYDLNNSGVSLNSDSRPLYRYRTRLNGNTLIIQN